MSRIICTASVKVKPVGNPRKPARPFGAGILRSVPSFKVDHTVSDEAWYAEQVQARADHESIHAHYDRLFAECEAIDRSSRGILL